MKKELNLSSLLFDRILFIQVGMCVEIYNVCNWLSVNPQCNKLIILKATYSD
jgi:hypothetical protein